MASVLDLTRDVDVREIAQKSVILAGRQIMKDGAVVFDKFLPELVRARVRAGVGTRSTELRTQGEKLTWKCTCATGRNSFCRHLVATALATQAKGRGDIYKAAGLIIKDRKVLAERSVGKPVFVQPGGRIDEGETPPQALVRELMEEFGLSVTEADLEFFGKFSAVAANHPTQQVHIEVFLVKQWRGEISPSSEVEETLWLTSSLPKGVEVASIFVHDIIPRLKAQDLID